jgi:hypothetical protein
MKITSSRIFYESPQITMLEMEVEKGFSASGDPIITNPDMEWGD